jgi:alpha-L-rhamnosidase
MKVAAQFIAPDRLDLQAPRLRTEVDIAVGHGAVADARLRLSALGVVEASIDGQPVSDDLLTPGWTSYEWRLRYSETDVTALLAEKAGRRIAIGLALGNGWYRTWLGAFGARAPHYGEELAGFAELQVTFADGHRQVIASDDTWTAAPGDTTENGLYDGQHIDARLRTPGWNTVGFDATGWGPVHAIEVDAAKLAPSLAPPVRRQFTVSPVRMWESARGTVMVDFGQNLVGWVRVRVQGAAGEQIVLRHAEVLEGDLLGTRPLQGAQATDVYTLSGGADVFEPTFTFHGFRFVEVEGWPGGLAQIGDDALAATVVSSDLRRTGHFTCSAPLLNQLHENVVWSMRGNFLDVPTDCPQRAERLGWTGDIAVFAPTAAYLFDVGAFLQDWLRDVAVEQANAGGRVPLVVPDIFKYMQTPFPASEPMAIWSDAVVWVPWAMWRAYGDQAALVEALPSMISHARRVQTLLSEDGVWDQGFQFGDWLDPDAPPDQPWAGKADPGVVATASAYRTACIVAEAAALCGRDDDASALRAMAEGLRAAFHGRYITGQRILSDCTAVYTLAIAFDLLTDEERLWAGHRLAELVREGGDRISTGFAATPYILDALSATGHDDVAYRLLLQEEMPSWLYPVKMGATTIWERWDSMLPDGSINPGDMTSFNHYALGSVADWMHRSIGGIAPLTPGYERVLLAPRPGGGIEWAESALDTPRGRIALRWELTDAGLGMTFDLPAGVTAVIRDRSGAEHEVAGPCENTTYHAG